MTNQVWGLGLPEGVSDDRVWYSARAILEGNNIDLLYDRGGFNRYPEEEVSRRVAMAAALHKFANRIREGERLDPTKGQLHEMEDDNYKMLYDTRGSYGYLYIVMWEKDREPSSEQPVHAKDATKTGI